MTAADRRARLVRRHHLTGAASSVEDAVAAVVALHATDPATVYLSVLARAVGLGLEDVGRALYEDRSLVRLMAMRRTLFVVPVEDAPIVHAAASLDVAARMRRGLVKDLTTLPTDPPLEQDVERWLTEVADATEAALVRRGTATAAQLATDEPRLRTALLPTTDKSYDVRRAITSPVLTMLGAEGRIVRGRPRGGWTSRAHTWEPASRWWPAGLPRFDPAEARAELARRWLKAFGPAPAADLQWWTGWSGSATAKALGAVQTVDVDLDGTAGLALAEDVDDLGTQAPTEPVAVLLPALDPTPMGYQRREWFLPVDRTPLFDRFGNIGPTVWWGGEVVGGWAVRPDGEVVWALLIDRGRAAEQAVADAASRLEDQLAGSPVTPSFPTPLERELRTATPPAG